MNFYYSCGNVKKISFYITLFGNFLNNPKKTLNYWAIICLLVVILPTTINAQTATVVFGSGSNSIPNFDSSLLTMPNNLSVSGVYHPEINFGGGLVDPAYYSFGITFPNQTPSYPGYNFVKWSYTYTRLGGTVGPVDVLPGQQVGTREYLASNYTYNAVAQWTEGTTIILKEYDGSSQSHPLRKGESFSFREPNVDRPGYYFTGWHKEGTDQRFKATDEFTDPSELDNASGTYRATWDAILTKTSQKDPNEYEWTNTITTQALQYLSVYEASVDMVFLVDFSYTMGLNNDPNHALSKQKNALNAIKTLTDEMLRDNPASRFGIIKYNYSNIGTSNEYLPRTLLNLSSSINTIANACDATYIDVAGQTYLSKGLDEVNNFFNDPVNAPIDSRRRVIVHISDGLPTVAYGHFADYSDVWYDHDHNSNTDRVQYSSRNASNRVVGEASAFFEIKYSPDQVYTTKFGNTTHKHTDGTDINLHELVTLREFDYYLNHHHELDFHNIVLTDQSTVSAFANDLVDVRHDDHDQALICVREDLESTYRYILDSYEDIITPLSQDAILTDTVPAYLNVIPTTIEVTVAGVVKPGVSAITTNYTDSYNEQATIITVDFGEYTNEEVKLVYDTELRDNFFTAGYNDYVANGGVIQNLGDPNEGEFPVNGGTWVEYPYLTPNGKEFEEKAPIPYAEVPDEEEDVVDFSDRLDTPNSAQNTIANYNNNGTPNDFTDDTADLMIGSTVTVDNSARTDDTDYDGTLNTVPTLTVSDNTYTISMPVKNVTGNDAKITAWVDFDGDGILEDTEKSNVYTVISQTSTTENVTLTWNNIWTTDPYDPNPQKIIPGEHTLRIRLTTDNVVLATGVGGYGEIEDYPIDIDAIIDYSDAPNYTEVANSITITNGSTDITLGSGVTDESSAIFDDTDNDDALVSSSNPTGTAPTMSVVATDYSVEVFYQTSVNAKIVAWLDINCDQNFDQNERIIIPVNANNSSTTLLWENITHIPDSSFTYMRIRISDSNNTDVEGAYTNASSGEVEDHEVIITSIADCCDITTIGLASNRILGFNRVDSTAALTLGTKVSYEATANSPDNDDHDDGLVGTNMPDLSKDATSYQIQVIVNNYLDDDAIVCAWVDFNGNGTLEQSERSNVVEIDDDTQNRTVPLSWNNINVTAQPGTINARIRIISDDDDCEDLLDDGDEDEKALGDGCGGEIEDYPVTVYQNYFDYSDAPNDGNDYTYGEAIHTITNFGNNTASIMIGEGITQESISFSNSTDNDDAFNFSIIVNQNLSSFSLYPLITTDEEVMVVAWLDINNNKSFDSNEMTQITQSISSTSTVELNWTITGIASDDALDRFLRIRVMKIADYNLGTPSPIGSIESGEVEDYPFTVADQFVDFCDDLKEIDNSYYNRNHVLLGYNPQNNTADLMLGDNVSSEASANSLDTFDDGVVDTNGNPITPPDIDITASTYSINVKVSTNLGNTDCKVVAWIDFDNDGIFKDREQSNNLSGITATGIYTLNWSGSGLNHINPGSNDQLNLRIRTARTSDGYGNIQNNVSSGEVEDHLINVTQNGYLDLSDDQIINNKSYVITKHIITGYISNDNISQLMLGDKISHEVTVKTYDDYDNGSNIGQISSKPGLIGSSTNFDNNQYTNNGLKVLTNLDDDSDDDGEGNDTPGVLEVPAYIAGSDTYYLIVNYTNYDNSKPVYITGWIDFNGNGVFNENVERKRLTIDPADQTGQDTLIWKLDNISNYFKNNGANRTELAMRIRIAYVRSEINYPGTLANSGEVEDYIVPVHITDWTGEVSDDWYDAGNWYSGVIPTGYNYGTRNVHIEDVTRLFYHPDRPDNDFPKLRAYYNGYANQLHIYNDAKFQMESTTQLNGASLLINDHTTLHIDDDILTNNINGFTSVKGRYIIDRYVSPDVKHIISSPINYGLNGTKMAQIPGYVENGNINGRDTIPYLGLTYSNYSDLMYTSEVQFNRWKDFFYGADNNNSFMDSESFDAGRGYWYQNDNTGGAGTGVTMFEFEGQPYEGYNETYSIPVYTYSSDKIDFMGQNTLGNPFSSTLAVTNRARNHGETVNNFINHNTNILPTDNQAVYIWNPRYTPSGAGSNKKAGAEDNQWIILANNGFAEQCDRSTCLHYVKPYQGFTIVAKPGVNNANAEFTRGMRAQYVPRDIDGNYKDFMYNGNPGGQENEYQYPGDGHPEDEPIFYKTSNTADQWLGVQLIGYNGSSEVNTIIGLNEKMTNDVDPSYDVGILKRAGKNEMYTYANGSTSHFAQLALPRTSGSVKIGFDIVETSAYNFRIFETGMKEVTLLDKLNGNTVDLLTNDYSVTLTQGTHEERFELFFTPFTTLELDPNTSEEINISCIDDVLHIENYIGDYIIYNVQGQKVYSGESTEYDYSNKLNLPQAVYLIETEGKAKKIYVQKRQ